MSFKLILVILKSTVHHHNFQFKLIFLKFTLPKTILVYLFIFSIKKFFFCFYVMYNVAWFVRIAVAAISKNVKISVLLQFILLLLVLDSSIVKLHYVFLLLHLSQFLGHPVQVTKKPRKQISLRQ